MSALGQKRKSGHVRVMSALPPIADIAESHWHVRFVPEADVSNCSKAAPYSITSSVRASSEAGTSRPRARAVAKLMMNSNLLD